MGIGGESSRNVAANVVAMVDGARNVAEIASSWSRSSRAVITSHLTESARGEGRREWRGVRFHPLDCLRLDQVGSGLGNATTRVNAGSAPRDRDLAADRRDTPDACRNPLCPDALRDTLRRGLSRPGPRQPPGIQDLDGPCRYAASGRSGWARQPLAQRTCRLHSLVSEGMPRPGDLHGGALRPRQSGRPPGAPCRAQRQAETRSRAPAARSPGPRPDRSRRGIPHYGAARAHCPARARRRWRLLASATPKGPVSLRFPVDTLEWLFPRLNPEP